MEEELKKLKMKKHIMKKYKELEKMIQYCQTW